MKFALSSTLLVLCLVSRFASADISAAMRDDRSFSAASRYVIGKHAPGSWTGYLSLQYAASGLPLQFRNLQLEDAAAKPGTTMTHGASTVDGSGNIVGTITLPGGGSYQDGTGTWCHVEATGFHIYDVTVRDAAIGGGAGSACIDNGCSGKICLSSSAGCDPAGSPTETCASMGSGDPCWDTLTNQSSTTWYYNARIYRGSYYTEESGTCQII